MPTGGGKGRDTVMTPEVIAKITLALSAGATKTAACLIADVSQDAFYDYVKKHPDFSDKIELLKDQPRLQARINLVNAINNDNIEVSKYYLDRTDDDFTPKKEAKIDGNLTVRTLLEQLVDDEEEPAEVEGE